MGCFVLMLWKNDLVVLYVCVVSAANAVRVQVSLLPKLERKKRRANGRASKEQCQSPILLGKLVLVLDSLRILLPNNNNPTDRQVCVLKNKKSIHADGSNILGSDQVHPEFSLRQDACRYL